MKIGIKVMNLNKILLRQNLAVGCNLSITSVRRLSNAFKSEIQIKKKQQKNIKINILMTKFEIRFSFRYEK